MNWRSGDMSNGMSMSIEPDSTYHSSDDLICRFGWIFLGVGWALVISA